jgi:large subunit ribosomal protein L24
VSIPQFLVQPENPDQRPIRTVEAPLDINAVRLVTPLDNGNGETKDVIVKKLVHANFKTYANGKVSWDRVIPGLDVKVPWPQREQKIPKEKEDTPSDTLRMEVDVKSYIPTLLRPPIPRSVIDELRNKYSVFRTRHEPEYIAQKEAEEQAKLEKKKTIKAMRTPLMEANRKERKLKRMKGKGKLTPDMLERIGKAIAEKRGLVIKDEPEATPEVLAA